MIHIGLDSNQCFCIPVYNRRLYWFIASLKFNDDKKIYYDIYTHWKNSKLHIFDKLLNYFAKPFSKTVLKMSDFRIWKVMQQFIKDMQFWIFPIRVYVIIYFLPFAKIQSNNDLSKKEQILGLKKSLLC